MIKLSGAINYRWQNQTLKAQNQTVTPASIDRSINSTMVRVAVGQWPREREIGIGSRQIGYPNLADITV